MKPTTRKTALKKKITWKKKVHRQARWGDGHWENPLGDIIEVEQIQDRDGKNAFMYTAVETNRSALGTARGKRKVIAKGRNEKLVLKKLREYMK